MDSLLTQTIPNTKTFNSVINFIRNIFNQPKEFIPLHEPRFTGNEKKYLNEAIDSTFVSSVGAFVDKFEQMMVQITGAKYAVATVNGTAALHIALILAGVKEDEEVITQPLTFVATCNAIAYTRSRPVFVDINRETLGMCPESLLYFLKNHTVIRDGKLYNKETGRRIAACVPMHTFGFPLQIEEISAICNEYKIPLIEDSAESLGSYVQDKHTGTFGLLGTFSFNGNKTVTCGGGGAIVTNDENLAKLAKHLTTTAKVPHKWEYVHDQVGYNYRMPNLNAALACAQLEQLDKFIANKRELANLYDTFFREEKIRFVKERENCKANYWLMTVILADKTERDAFLTQTNSAAVMTRPAWHLMNELEMFNKSFSVDLSNSVWAADRVVNIPSSVRLK